MKNQTDWGDSQKSIVVSLYRSFSHDVTVAIFVYKTVDRRPCLCTKKNPVGIELFSHVKTFFYSKQFAKLLTTRLKTNGLVFAFKLVQVPLHY